LSFFAGQIVVGPFSIYLKIAILILPIIGIFLLLNPMWGFMILLFIRPLVDPLRNYYLLGGVNLLGVFSFINVLFAFYVLIKIQNVRLFPENIKWCYIYLFTALLSIANSLDIGISFIAMMKLISLMALFLLAYNLPKSLDDALKIIKVIFISSVIPIVYGIYQLITGQGVQRQREGLLADVPRIESTFVLSNEFAFYLGIIILVFVLRQFYLHRKVEHAVNIFIFAGALVCLLYTYTRGVWLSLLLSLGCIAVFEKRFRRWLIILTLICIPLFSDNILNRFDDLINPPKYGTNSLVSRFEIYKALLFKAFPEQPFLGFGLGVSQEALRQYLGYKNIPHNDYIRVLVETGILGFIVYVVFLGKIFFYLLGLIRRKVNFHANTVFFGILIFYLISSMAQNSFFHISSAGYIFVLMGLAQKINDISEINKEERTI
jgi:O-antigen ligase